MRLENQACLRSQVRRLIAPLQFRLFLIVLFFVLESFGNYERFETWVTNRLFIVTCRTLHWRNIIVSEQFQQGCFSLVIRIRLKKLRLFSLAVNLAIGEQMAAIPYVYELFLLRWFRVVKRHINYLHWAETFTRRRNETIQWLVQQSIHRFLHARTHSVRWYPLLNRFREHLQ